MVKFQCCWSAIKPVWCLYDYIIWLNHSTRDLLTGFRQLIINICFLKMQQQMQVFTSVFSGGKSHLLKSFSWQNVTYSRYVFYLKVETNIQCRVKWLAPEAPVWAFTTGNWELNHSMSDERKVKSCMCC